MPRRVCEDGVSVAYLSDVQSVLFLFSILSQPCCLVNGVKPAQKTDSATRQ